MPDHLAVAIEVPFKWKRLSPLLPELELDLTQPRDMWPALVDAYNLDLADAVRAGVRDWLASAEGRCWGWRRGARILPSNYVNPEAWNQWLEVIRQQRVMLRDALPDLVPALLLEAATDPFAPDTLNLRVAIENRTQLPAGRLAATMEFGLFQASVEVDLPPRALRPLPLDRVKPSYHLTGFLEQPAIGVNGGVSHAPLREGDRLRTTWMPRFVQPRIVPRQLDAVVTNYGGLAAGTPDTIDGLLHLADEMDAWITQTQTEVDLLAGIDPANQLAIEREKRRFTADLEAWKAEAAAIRAGADLLARSRAAWERSPTNAEASPFPPGWR